MWLALLTALLLTVAAPLSAQAAPPQQVVLIVADDLTFKAVGAYGSTIYTQALDTPNINALAAAGVRFDRNYVPQSTCTPARATLLTGQYWTRHGVLETGATEILGPNATTIADLMRAAGYRTAVFGKYNLIKNIDTSYTPADHGFDDYDVFPPNTNQGTYDNATHVTNYVHTAPLDISHTLNTCPLTGLVPSDANPCTRNISGHSVAEIFEIAQEWLMDHEGEKVFAIINPKGPHDPVVYETANEDLLPGGATPYDLAYPSSWDDTVPRAGRTGTGQTAGESLLTLYDVWQTTTWQNPRPGGYGKAGSCTGTTDTEKIACQYQRQLKDYLRTLRSVDTGVGDLVSYFASVGETASTAILFTSDNGYLLGEHGGMYAKTVMYEESIRTPLIIKYPCGASCGVAPAAIAGSSHSELTTSVDIAPTILELAEVTVPAAMQGSSLVSLMAGTTPAGWRTSFYYHFTGTDVTDPWGLVTDRYKLIYYPLAAVPNYELIDLVNDPDERTDIAAANPALVAQLKALMWAQQAAIGEGRTVRGGRVRGTLR